MSCSKETTKTINDGDIKHLTNDRMGECFNMGAMFHRESLGLTTWELCAQKKIRPPAPPQKNDRILIAMIQFCTTIVDPSNHEPQKILDKSCGEIPAIKPRALLVNRKFSSSRICGVKGDAWLYMPWLLGN